MFLLASDLDGTIDSEPAVFQSLFSAVRKAGGQVAVLTGVKGAATITAADVQAKRDRLSQLGVTDYDQLAVFPDDGDIPDLKAKWCRDHDVDVLIDNLKPTAKAASKVTLVLVPWATRTK